MAISSNGTHSFVELLYPTGGIQWIQGESHPNGLPDARAQAGFMSEGIMYTLKGSGTDQIQNIDKYINQFIIKIFIILLLKYIYEYKLLFYLSRLRWSNTNRPGQWIFHVGPIAEGRNVKPPDNIESMFKLNSTKK